MEGDGECLVCWGRCGDVMMADVVVVMLCYSAIVVVVSVVLSSLSSPSSLSLSL